tara:strand:+ start:199988 stop:200716 length:729 start_codon:yes stop_codon:yes gene_type:complete
MITLFTYAPAFGEFSASPFCVKAAWLLNLSGLPWQRKDTNDPRSFPNQKLPAIGVDGRIIGDSDNIRRYLEQQGAVFDAGLTDIEKSTSRAFIRMAEEHLYFHVMLDRWADDERWPLIRETYFASIPKPLRKFITGKIRRDVLHGMRTQGLGRLTPVERQDRIEPDLQAITIRLWQGKFLFADHPTAADTSVAAMLAAVCATPGASLLKERITKDEVLSSYIARTKRAMAAPLSAASERLCA